MSQVESQLTERSVYATVAAKGCTGLETYKATLGQSAMIIGLAKSIGFVMCMMCIRFEL